MNAGQKTTTVVVVTLLAALVWLGQPAGRPIRAQTQRPGIIVPQEVIVTNGTTQPVPIVATADGINVNISRSSVIPVSANGTLPVRVTNFPAPTPPEAWEASVIEAPTASELKTRLGELLEEGWEPVGMVTMADAKSRPRLVVLLRRKANARAPATRPN